MISLTCIVYAVLLSSCVMKSSRATSDYSNGNTFEEDFFKRGINHAGNLKRSSREFIGNALQDIINQDYLPTYSVEDTLKEDGRAKRKFDIGYGGRSGAAMNLASKLLADDLVAKLRRQKQK